MKDSRISLKRRLEKRGRSIWIAAGVALLYFVAPVHAVDPHRRISQYMRERWGSEKGFPGGLVSSIAQTADGYLWIGTDRGLIRFDGLNFRVFQHSVPGLLPIGPVRGLLTDTEANLWVLLQDTKVLRYHDGEFEPGRDQAEFGITAVGRRGNGSVLLSSLAYGVLTYSRGRFEILPVRTGEPLESRPTLTAKTYDDRSSRLSWATSVATHRLAEPNSAVTSTAETTDGKVWLATQDRGLFYMSEGRVFAIGNGLQNTKITCLLPLDNGELWIGTESGVQKWNGVRVTLAGVPSLLHHTRVLAMLRDRDSNIWVGTAGGLVRVNRDKVSFEGGSGASGPVSALFEDREGNLWVGSPRGVERLRDSAFVAYSVAGFQSESSGPIYVDEEERAWFAPPAGGLHWLKGGKTGSVKDDQLAQDVIYSIAGSSKGLWIGRQRGGLTRLQYSQGSIRVHSYTEADGLSQNSVYSVYLSPDGAVWAGTLSGGVSRFADGRFTNYSTASGLASNTVTSILETRDSTIWFATPSGLGSLSKGQWKTYAVRDGLPSENVICLFEDTAGTLWTGTSDGLAFLSSGHIQVPSNLPELLRGQVFGIAEDKNGWFWIATAEHVLRVKRDRLVSSMLGPADLHEYGPEDGLSGVKGVKRSRSVASDPSGRIWFSLSRGISVVDPSHLSETSAPVITHIDEFSIDGGPMKIRDLVHVPASPKRITFTFTGLSLAAPERVRFRYFLEGFDRAWSEPVTNREAVYTNLGPGPYRFRVAASNSDEPGNSSEAALRFKIEPAYWQTWWFRTGSVALILLLVLCTHLYHLRQLAKQFSIRLEERVSERTRIARELHDTLLQSFQGLLLRFQGAANLLPTRPTDAKERLDSAIDQAAQAITEGRDAVQGLRASTLVTNDLAGALSALGEELAAMAADANQSPPAFSVEVEGATRNLQPILRDEVYRIVGEAVRNTFLHAEARRIEVGIYYDEHQLRLRIRDDGKGIDSGVLDGEGRAGHWGLRGMRERAKLVGGKLEVWSKLQYGTEVELSIPASVAYASSGTRRRSWFSRKETATKS